MHPNTAPEPHPARPGPIEAGAIRGSGPADEQALEPVAVSSPADVAAAVERAREAQRRHAERDVGERARLLRLLRDAILSRGDALVRALRAEIGKPEAEAWLHEVLPTADLAGYWATEGPALLAAQEPALDALQYPGKRAMVERQPRGVVALITPWNFPVALPLRTLFPALLAGDAVILKPSEHAPRSAALLAEAAAEVYGPDLVGVVQGGGDVGETLLRAGIDAVVFTGSVPTGRKVAHLAADALVPVALELGGKDAAIVLDDAPVERAARGILWSGVANAGQNCAAVERVYATPAIARPLAERMAALAGALVPGRDYGPLATEAQRARVEEHVRSAVAAGAELLCGGRRLERPGLWFEPTVLCGAPSGDPSMVEETFGPVVPVLEVPNDRAAVDAANASRYGLNASVWTRDLGRGERLARQLRAGVVLVNNHAFTGAVPALPWSGVGESGYGVTNSPHALDILTRPRTILVDASRAKRELWWYPYTPALVRMARSMATLRHRAGVGRKLRAVTELPGAFARRWKSP